MDIVCQVNPEFIPDVRYENGKKVLYVRILKALYGMIESALLWYTLYVTVLKKEGFVLNPYDKCVANKMYNEKQCTVAFYVDDNKLSHVDTAVVDKVLGVIEGYFPGLVVERGKKLNFLGVEIEFTDNKRVKLSTIQYLKTMIEEFDEDLSKHVSSPAAKWLMTVKDETKKLSKEQAEKFVSFVYKLLWVTKRSRPDIETSVSFLCTRVKEPDKDDWCKLKRAMTWIKQTIDDVRVIGADSLYEMFTFIDSAHSVHPNMRGHTGGMTTFGTGIIDQKSSKQKMNTRSSTETEVVGTSEYLPKNIYFELFMEAQGYKLQRNILAEDNESTIRMSKNGKDSCTSNLKHIAIKKYFWVTDQIKNGNIEIIHCPTKQMIADYFTKPLQGELFHMFRNIIMGWTHISTVFTSYHAAKERVGNSENSDLSVETKILENKNYEDENSKGILAAKQMTEQVKKRTYADAVREQNLEVLRAQNEITNLKILGTGEKYKTSEKYRTSDPQSAGDNEK